MTPQTHSPLDNLHVATPCRARWERMDVVDETGAARFCRTCEKNVYNVSTMSRGETEALLRRHEGENLFEGFALRADGMLITDDCPVGVSAGRQKQRLTVVFLAMMAVLLPSPLSRGLRRITAFACRTVPVIKSLGETQRGQKVMMWLDAPQPTPTPTVFQGMNS